MSQIKVLCPSSPPSSLISTLIVCSCQIKLCCSAEVCFVHELFSTSLSLRKRFLRMGIWYWGPPVTHVKSWKDKCTKVIYRYTAQKEEQLQPSTISLSVFAWYKSRAASLISAKLYLRLLSSALHTVNHRLSVLGWICLCCASAQGHHNSGKSREASGVPTQS